MLLCSSTLLLLKLSISYMLKTVPNISDVTENDRVGSTKGSSLHKNINKNKNNNNNKHIRINFVRTLENSQKLNLNYEKSQTRQKSFVTSLSVLFPAFSQFRGSLRDSILCPSAAPIPSSRGSRTSLTNKKCVVCSNLSESWLKD